MTDQQQAQPAGTRAERMRTPLAADVIRATAEKHGVCVRPFTMEVGDTETGELRYVAVPCGSTVESVCLPCARKAKALRQAQCREGWHMTEEPNLTTAPPTEDQKELLTYRADLVAAYREVAEHGPGGERRNFATRSPGSMRNFGNSGCAVACQRSTCRPSGQ